jgi:hypothetical protein
MRQLWETGVELGILAAFAREEGANEEGQLGRGGLIMDDDG